jgi:hypothetical protein
MFYVYVHKRASDGAIFYVGKGSGQRAWSKNKRGLHWHAVCRKHGVTIEIVRRFDSEEESFVFERALIAECRAKAIALANKTDGGEGAAGVKHTAETKAIWAAAKLGKKRGPHSDQHKLNISAALRGKPCPDERKERIAKATAAAMKNPAIIEKMRLAKLGKTRRPHTVATREKMRAAALGRPKSLQARANMSAAQKRRFAQEVTWISAVSQ